MNSELGLVSISRRVADSIGRDLQRVGVMHRIFSRVKADSSVQRKVKEKSYSEGEGKVTDLIGIRITLYFQDDVDVVYEHLKSSCNFDHDSTDEFSREEFKPTRCNLTFRFEGDDLREVSSIISNRSDTIDATYEVQIRTVLSEGWHEVEHDLRYKCSDDWNGYDDLHRNLNGIYATLETSEFGMLQLFSELSRRHYTQLNVQGLFRAHFRLRFVGDDMSSSLQDYLNNKEVLKQFRRVNRVEFIRTMLQSKYALPLTLDNICYACNHLYVNDGAIRKLAGDFISQELRLSFSSSDES